MIFSCTENLTDVILWPFYERIFISDNSEQTVNTVILSAALEKWFIRSLIISCLLYFTILYQKYDRASAIVFYLS